MNETVASFNEKYPIGTPVRYFPIKGEDDYIDTAIEIMNENNE